MILFNLWERQNAMKALYSKCVGTICNRHEMTRMELDILLFLANNPQYDTATEIVEVRYLSKSQVSSSIKLLEAKGYLRKEYASDNRKTAHLKICEEVYPIIADGREAQKKFIAIMLQGFTREDIECMKRYTDHIMKNISEYLEEE